MYIIEKKIARWKVEGRQGGGKESIEKAMTTVRRRRGIKCDSGIPSKKETLVDQVADDVFLKGRDREETGSQGSKVLAALSWCLSCSPSQQTPKFGPLQLPPSPGG